MATIRLDTIVHVACASVVITSRAFVGRGGKSVATAPVHVACASVVTASEVPVRLHQRLRHMHGRCADRGGACVGVVWCRLKQKK